MFSDSENNPSIKYENTELNSALKVYFRNMTIIARSVRL